MWLFDTVMILFNSIFILLLLKNVKPGNEEKSSVALAFLIPSTILNSILYSTLNEQFKLLPLIMIAIYVLLARCVLKMSFWHAVIGVVTFYLLTAIGETVSYLILIENMNYDVTQIQNSISLNIAVHLIDYVFTIIGAIIINIGKKRNTTPSKSKVIMNIAILLILIMADFIVIAYMIEDSGDIIVINLICLLTVLCLSMLYISMTQTLIIKNDENTELKTYIDTIDELTQELRRFRHNYLNILYAFEGYIENKEWDKLEEYYYEVVQESRKINNSNVISYQKIKNSAILGLISQKIKRANELGLSIILEVPNTITTIGISNSDICEVFGIYLDNAIEAAVESDEKVVKITIDQKEDFFEVIVENSFRKELDLNRIHEKGYTTKGENNKGIGLYLAKKILSKYDNVLNNTYVRNNYFIQQIVINNEKNEIP